MFDLRKLKLANDDELMGSCVKFEVFLRHGVHLDVNGQDVSLEFKMLGEVLSQKGYRGIKLFQKNGGLLPNTIDNPGFSCFCKHKFFKVEVDKKLSRLCKDYK